MKKCLFALVLMSGFIHPAFASGLTSSEFPDTEDLTNTSHVGAPEDPESQESNAQGARLGDTENLTPSEQDTEDRKDMSQMVPLDLEELPSSYSSVSLPDLPAELVVMITAYLSPKETVFLMQTCTTLHDILSEFPGMRSLNLFNRPCSLEDVLEHISSFPALRHLNLKSTHITDKGVAHLPPNLTSLNLGHTHITDKGVAPLPPSLTYLNLGHTHITDKGVAPLSQLSNLTSLDLWGTNITDAGVVSLSSLSNLTSLNLWGTHITDKGVAHLPPSLTSLDLGNTHITDEGVVHLPLSLTSLDLRWCEQLTDAGLVSLSSLSNLTSLDLWGTYITDAGVVHLPLSLTSLDLGDTHITDAGVVHLPLSLTSLDLGNTHITQEGVDALRAAGIQVTVIAK